MLGVRSPNGAAAETEVSATERRLTMNARTAQGVVLALAVLLAGLAGGLAPATAAAGGQGQHCGVGVDGGGKEACFATFAEAMAAATGGRARLGRDVRPGEVTERMLGQDGGRQRAGAAASLNTVVGIAWSDQK